MTADTPHQNPGLKLTAMAIPDLARVLTKCIGKPFAEESIRKDVQAGAPTNPDGTINLVHYAAWLAREYSDHGD